MRFLLVLLTVLAASAYAEDATFDIQLNHVTLLVSDIEESADFYRDILKLRELETPWGEISWGRMFAIGTAGELHLAKGTREANNRSKHVHYAFSVSNFDAYLSFLTEHDVEYGDFEGTPGALQTRPDGVRQVYFQDPDGYWIEVNDIF